MCNKYEALEENLDIARKAHVAAEVDLLKANEKIQELEYIIADSIRLLEKSEHPFYLGIKLLKDSI